MRHRPLPPQGPDAAYALELEEALRHPRLAQCTIAAHVPHKDSTKMDIKTNLFVSLPWFLLSNLLFLTIAQLLVF